MTSSPRIGVAGSLAYDYLSIYEGAFEEVLLPEMLNRLSVCFYVPRQERHFGGTGGNIAYNLGLLESRPLLMGRVGIDFDDYAKHLTAVSISLDHVEHSKTVRTACANIITDRNGHQISEFYPGAMNEDLEADLTDALKTLSVLIIAPDKPGRMLFLAGRAAALKIPYFFDPGQNVPLFTEAELKIAVSEAKGLFLNEYELELLRQKIGFSQEDFVREDKILIVTQGEKGSSIFTKVHSISIPIVKPNTIKNPTGCGDAYRAGFLKGFVEGRDLETCGRIGALMAAYNVEHEGTQTHSFTLEEFEKRYQDSFSIPL
ncbi:MAG: carbohydrate kinase family protein [Candidatus Gracilibacteria bacterium]